MKSGSYQRRKKVQPHQQNHQYSQEVVQQEAQVQSHHYFQRAYHKSVLLHPITTTMIILLEAIHRRVHP